MSSRIRTLAVAAAAALPPLIVLGVGGLSAEAGTIRHDTSDSLYTALANQPAYAPVGAVLGTTGAGTFISSGTLISSQWVLTAAHVVDGSTITTMAFNIGGTTATNGTQYTAANWLAHSAWTGELNLGLDVGLIRLSAPVTGLTPASRYTSEDELEQIGTFVGYGRTGTGLSGATEESGTKRAGTNVIDVFGSDAGDRSNRLMFVDFDHPSDPGLSRWGSSTPTPLEYLGAPGDSGGGVFLQAGPEARLAGVMSFILNSPGTTVGTYGDAVGSVRVSQFNQWIDDTIAVYWNSSASGSFSSAGNWSHAVPHDGAPTTGDIAGLRESGTYTITFDSNVSNERLLARGGNVTMNLAGRTYTLTSPAFEGALVVGKYAGESAAVTFIGGTVNSTSAVIGELAGSSGTVRIENATWSNGSGGRVFVGGSTLAPGGTGTIEIRSGSNVDISRLKVWNNGTVHYNGGEFIARQLELVGGGSVLLSSGGGKSLQNITVSIDSAAGSRIDLADNEMQVFGTSFSDVYDLVKIGHAGGSWTGPGITSSAAAAEAGRALGIGPFHDGSTMVKFTWGGDATLSGSVNISDLSILAANWQKGPAGPSMSFAEAMALFDAFNDVVVPEPGSLSLLGLGGLLALRRRG